LGVVWGCVINVRRLVNSSPIDCDRVNVQFFALNQPAFIWYNFLEFLQVRSGSQKENVLALL